MPGRKVVVAGGTGFIGRRLVAALATTGEQVVVLSRHPRSAEGSPPGVREVFWDARTLGDWASELDGAYAVINLTGESIAQHWSEAAKARILSSRTESAGAIASAIQRAKTPPKRWINSSAIGYYGDRGDEELDEISSPGNGFLAETCVAWEAAVMATPLPATSRSIVRIGFVLGPEGALPTLAKLAHRGLGGSVGPGSQGVSWVDLHDVVGIMEWLLDVSAPPEIVNATAPFPATNAKLMAAIREAVHASLGLPAPAFAVRALGKLFGPDPELVLDGAKVLPRVALARGYAFKFTDLRTAVEEEIAAIRP